MVDVGSNSVRMVVFEGNSRAPAVLYNEKVMCGLGAQLAETGALDPQGKMRALGALRRFSALAPGLRIGALCGVATAAIREAVDGPAFRELVEQETGIRLIVASGVEEARLAAKGVLFGNPSADGVMVDLGGGSLEFTRIRRGEVAEGTTTPLGPLRLSAFDQDGKAEDEIDRHLGEIGEAYKLEGGTLYLVGGSWRALAKVQMVRSAHPVQVVHEYRMSRREAETLCDEVASETPETLITMQGVSSSRVGYLPLSAKLLRRVMYWTDPSEIRCSGFGLREGVCLENMPESIRSQDPLIAACREHEMRRARAPGFGSELGDWVQMVLPPRSPREARLMRAAATLSDVNWRTHPDFRAEGCWETVTRTSITDVGHEGRVWLGAALVVRYKTRGRRRLEEMPEVSLLGEEELDRAEKLGHALRLGVTLSGAAPGILQHSRVFKTDELLTLELDPEIRGFAGEEVEKRLAHLARDMDLDWEL
ncbi:MAG: Ppx/GppA family phosphatase, partial [Pseudomonadota bacterium]